jgi:small subunit ribosomal protein S21
VIEIKVLNGDLEGALVLLKRQCQRDAIHSEIKRRETFIKPSTRKKAKAAAARVRRRKVEIRRERQREAMEIFRMMRQQRPLRGRGRT